MLLGSTLFGVPVPAGAQTGTATEPTGDDEALDFGDDEAFDFGGDEVFDVDLDLPPPPPPPSPWWVTGFLRTDQHVWLERLTDHSLAKARQSLDLVAGYKASGLRLLAHVHAELDLAYLLESSRYDEPTKRDYTWLVDTREVLAAWSLGALELTVGRQIVAFGEGDMLSPLDVFNPQDLREPGLSDLDDIRLPTLATRIGWFAGHHRLEVMVGHESGWGYRSPPRGPFSPIDALIEREGEANPLLVTLLEGKELDYEHPQPRFALDQQQVFARWVYKGHGLDLGAYASSVLDQQGIFEIPLDQDLSAERLEVRVDHRRYEMLGLSGAWPWEAFLVKWELGYEVGRPMNVGAFGASLGTTRSDLVDLMLGVTWSPSTTATIGLEVLDPILVEAPDAGSEGELLFDPGTPSLALRARDTYFRERLTVQGAILTMGWTAEEGWLARASASWALQDGLDLTAGLVTYQPTDEIGPLFGLTRHDRASLALRWDFQLL